MGGKVKYNQLSDFQKKKYLGEFYDMVSLLGGREEAKKFFKDILTLSEVVMISRRIQIAKMLLDGKNFEDIQKEMKVGSNTISHVERWLNNGFGGYKEIINRHKKNKVKKEREIEDRLSTTPFSWKAIKKKYPLHFLLLNALDRRK